ncbi:MAG: DUF378 domain-containing protein [Defluviitaleaceae bacterium]|nr:DUF378 domain-containing protein [Defluviitaleaceae bacterium]
MDGSRFLKWTCLTLIVIGAINWGLIGFFQFDLIAAIFGGVSAWFSRTIYALIGLAGLYGLTFYARMDENHTHDHIRQNQ